MAFYHSPDQINSLTTPADTYLPDKALPPIGQRPDDVRWPARKILSGDWTSNHYPCHPDNGWWCWQGRRNVLLADGHCICADANDVLPANDHFPNPNLTKDGTKGYDLRN
jgi:prepilin-type processing-associated H-X9-DG protein